MPQPGDLQTKLNSLVAQVSHRFRGPPFDFHVTLLGGIKSSDLEASSKLNWAVGTWACVC